MTERKAQESSGAAQRSYLFLSMILLVWNTLSTGEFFFRSGFPGSYPPPAEVPVVTLPSPEASPPGIPVSPRGEPLSIRQKYLLGKRVDINKALKDEINELPGISEAMAAAIIAERERVGRFRSPRDLLAVKGIKEKRLKKILPFLVEMENN